MPVLLVQGEEDYQVTMKDFAIWLDAFGARDNWQMISYPGLTHLFMPGQRTEGASAYTHGGHVQDKVIEDIAAFIDGGLR